MTCIATKERARLMSDGSLYNLMAGKCLDCAIIAHTVLSERAQAKNAAEKALDRSANTEKQKGEGQLVNGKPKYPAALMMSDS